MSDQMGIYLMCQGSTQSFFFEDRWFWYADFDLLSHDDWYPWKGIIREYDIHSIDFFLNQIFFYHFFHLRKFERFSQNTFFCAEFFSIQHFFFSGFEQSIIKFTKKFFIIEWYIFKILFAICEDKIPSEFQFFKFLQK